jgi:hypothetical protein
MKFDMTKFHLQDHQHKSGCPASPFRQDIFVVTLMTKGPRGESVPGDKAMQSRCMDCGRGRIFKLDESELAEVEGRGSADVDDGEEVADGLQ